MIGSLLRLQFSAVLSVSIGALCAFGNPARYRSLSYEGIANMGGVRAWGYVLLIFGSVLLTCLVRRTHPAIIATSAVLVTAWYAAWCGGFAYAAMQDPVPGTDGLPQQVAWLGSLLWAYFAALWASVAYAAARQITKGGP